MAEYFVKAKPDSTAHGPFSGAQIKALAAKGKLRPEHLVSRDREKWVKAQQVKGLSFPESGKPGSPEAAPSSSSDVAEVTALAPPETAQDAPYELMPEEAEESRGGGGPLRVEKEDVACLLVDAKELVESKEGKVFFAGRKGYDRCVKWMGFRFPIASDETPLGAYVYCSKSMMGKLTFKDGVLFTNRAIHTGGIGGRSTSIGYDEITDVANAPPVKDGYGASIDMPFLTTEKAQGRLRALLLATTPEKRKQWRKERDEGLEKSRDAATISALTGVIMVVTAIVIKVGQPRTPIWQIGLAVAVIGFIPAAILAAIIRHIFKSAFTRKKRKKR